MPSFRTRVLTKSSKLAPAPCLLIALADLERERSQGTARWTRSVRAALDEATRMTLFCGSSHMLLPCLPGEGKGVKGDFPLAGSGRARFSLEVSAKQKLPFFSNAEAFVFPGVYGICCLTPYQGLYRRLQVSRHNK